MKIKTSIFPLFIWSLILITGSCDPEIDAPQYPLQAEFLAYMYFHEGTYWVYEDTASGDIDSGVVTSNIKLYVDEYNRDVLQSRRESFEYVVEYPESGRSYKYSGESTCESGQGGSRCGFAIHKRIDSASGWSYIYFYPPAADVKSETPNHVFVTIKQIIPEVEIAGEKFRDVVEIYDPKNAVEADMETYYWIAPGVGIIQKRFRQAGAEWHVMNLKRWYIVQ